MDLKSVCEKGTKYRTRRRVGRGIGSGHGKTCGRGHKGWGARSGSTRRPGYEGGQMPIYRRVPVRGFTNARFRTEYTIINVDRLSVFADGDTVNLDHVLAKGLVSMNTRNFKVLGGGDLGVKLTVQAHKFTKSAVEKIEQAGGSAVILETVSHHAARKGRGKKGLEATAASAPESANPESSNEGEASDQ